MSEKEKQIIFTDSYYRELQRIVTKSYRELQRELQRVTESCWDGENMSSGDTTVTPQ